MMMDQVDVVIVGGSFAGMSAALQLGRARRSIRLFDTNQPRNRFATTAHGFLGHDGRTPTEIRELGRGNLATYPTIEIVDARVVAIAAQGEAFLVHADGMETLRAERIILAYGLKDELPAIEGLEAAWGQNVMQCPYCHGYEVRDRRLGVLYTSDASLHQVKLIPDWSSDVTFFTNGSEIEPDQLSAVTDLGIRVVTGPVEGIGLDEDGAMRAIRVGDTHHGLDGLFLITRTHQATDLAARLGCKFEDGPFGPYIAVDGRQETSVKGVYAAGDIARPIHQSVWAAADGSSAGAFCHQSLLGHRNPYQKKVA